MCWPMMNCCLRWRVLESSHQQAEGQPQRVFAGESARHRQRRTSEDRLLAHACHPWHQRPEETAQAILQRLEPLRSLLTCPCCLLSVCSQGSLQARSSLPCTATCIAHCSWLFALPLTTANIERSKTWRSLRWCVSCPVVTELVGNPSSVLSKTGACVLPVDLGPQIWPFGGLEGLWLLPHFHTSQPTMLC